MLTIQERYFIWNILHPFNEIKRLIGADGLPIYNDDQYSLLKERMGLLCSKVLHIFEQPEFSHIHGKTKREDLNNNNDSFHRVLSYGIKEKHGLISSQYYSDLNLTTTLSAYVYVAQLKYDYFYRSIITDGAGNKFNLLYDLYSVINDLINLYGLNFDQLDRVDQPSPKHSISNNTVELHTLDISNYYQSETANIQTFIENKGTWIHADLPFYIDFRILSTKTPA